ncbi:hypothetical protein V6N12_040369 [Hibiscus sabdariffa]|uniref:Uncharacterized protein n=1 Tax=Hibiscus sabdariffa TaxID=183260 RepID=A0ABR2E3H7_9ROSI
MTDKEMKAMAVEDKMQDVVKPTYLPHISDEQNRQHLDHIHRLEELHAAVVLITVHPGRRIHLDTRPAMFEPHVQNNQLMVKFVVVDEIRHVLPRVKLNHSNDCRRKAKVRDFGDFRPLAKLPGLVRFVTHHEDEFYIVASPHHLEQSLYQEQQWPW